jgi:hypothetical protein
MAQRIGNIALPAHQGVAAFLEAVERRRLVGEIDAERAGVHLLEANRERDPGHARFDRLARQV